MHVRCAYRHRPAWLVHVLSIRMETRILPTTERRFAREDGLNLEREDQVFEGTRRLVGRSQPPHGMRRQCYLTRGKPPDKTAESDGCGLPLVRCIGQAGRRCVGIDRLFKNSTVRTAAKRRSARILATANASPTLARRARSFYW